MSWTATPIHVIDFEGSPSSGVVEYGIVTLKDSQIINTYTRLCRPLEMISSIESNMHHIHNEDVTHCQPFDSEWDLFSSLRQSGPFGAHHASVENAFLKSTWPHPPACNDFFHSDNQTTTWGPWVDTCQIYKMLYPQLKTHKLMSLISAFYLNEQLDLLADQYAPEARRRPHCALYDALASSLLLTYLASVPQFASKSLQWLIATSTKDPVKAANLCQATFRL